MPHDMTRHGIPWLDHRGGAEGVAGGAGGGARGGDGSHAGGARTASAAAKSFGVDSSNDPWAAGTEWCDSAQANV